MGSSGSEVRSGARVAASILPPLTARQCMELILTETQGEELICPLLTLVFLIAPSAHIVHCCILPR